MTFFGKKSDLLAKTRKTAIFLLFFEKKNLKKFGCHGDHRCEKMSNFFVVFEVKKMFFRNLKTLKKI